MEDFDKNELPAEDAGEQTIESGESVDNAEVCDDPAEEEALSGEGEGEIVPADEVCESEALEVAQAETEKSTPLFDYGELLRKEQEERRFKTNRVIGIVAICLSVVAIISSMLAAFLALASIAFADGEGLLDDPKPQVITQISERVVYVREDTPESGVLTTQEAYAKCIDSVVSIAVTSATSSGSGSGFIISEDGYIVTAAHVVDGAAYVKVILNNNEIYDAQIIGSDTYTDVALLKIEASGLEPIEIGKSSELLVGDDVIAIGTPASLDYNGSLAFGKVSYMDRMMKIYDDYGEVEKMMTVIQTSALVNSGNSGCPLINERGEAVGIVVMKLKSTYFEGMSFALPLDAAMPIIEAMKAGEDYTELQAGISTRPALAGVTLAEVRINVNGVRGLQIESFASGELDIKSKMKVGDVITHVDGIAVQELFDMKYLLDRKSPGDTIAITFYRGLQSMTVEVVLGSK